MPTYKITDPETGRVIRLTGDSPPTEQELEQIFASQRPSQQQVPLDRAGRQQFFEEEVEGISPLEAGLASVGRGVKTVGRGLGLVDPESEFEKQFYQSLEKEHPISTTVGDVAGKVAPFLLPAGAIGQIPTVPARVAAATGLGAAEGGIIARGEEGGLEQQLTSAGIGGGVAGAAELLMPRIISAGSKLIRRVLGKAPEGQIIDAAGRPSAEFQKALDSTGISIDDIAEQERLALAGQAVDPRQAARRVALESQGLKPTRAQVTRTADDFQAQQEAAKTSGKVSSALAEQEATLSTRFDNAVVESGGSAVTPTSTVTDALVNKATKLDDEISALYKQAREATVGQPAIRAEKLAATIKSLKGQDKATGGAISAIKSDLMDKGIIDNQFNVIGRLDVQTAEDARKVMNQLYDPQQPFRNIKLRQVKDALDDDVFKSAGTSVFEQGRKAKLAFERELSKAKVSKFDSNKRNLVRDVLENKIDPDQLADKVVFGKTYRDTDLKQLKDYISTDEAGKKAFDDLRAETLFKIKEKAFIGPKDEAGFQVLSRDKLQKALASIGKKKMDVLFTPKEQKFLNDMLKVAEIREPVRGTAVGQGPSAQAINRLRAELRQGSIMLNILDSVSFDKAGRAALKSSPDRLAEKGMQPRARSAQQIAGQTGAIMAADMEQEEQQ